MKIKILLIMSIIAFSGFAQDSLKVDSFETRVFSLTPRFKKVDKVNGLAIGVGLNFIDEGSIEKVNGLNVEINPLSPLILLMADPERAGFPEESLLVQNGINISTGNFNNSKLNGLGLSIFNLGYSCNGISINGVYNYSTKLNGLHISGIGNFSKKANGFFIAAFNDSEIINGVQIGICNKSSEFKGLQIGITNKTKTQKGLQIGFWNINSKRSMPFLNW